MGETPEVITHPNIHAALAAFQGELKPMDKSAEVSFPMKSGNGNVSFKYTPLSEIMSNIYPLLAKHQLAVRHEIVRGGVLGTKEGVEAILTHATFKSDLILKGEKVKEFEGVTETEKEHGSHAENELRSGVVFINQGGEMKDTGAAITYARRYTLTMLLGISSEEDKDAALFEERAGSAMGFAYSKAKQGIENAKTTADVEKAAKILKDDLAKLKSGKSGALGLDEKQYTELIKMADERIAVLDGDQTDGEGSSGKGKGGKV